MSIGSGVAIYFIIWWLVLFAVLPWGVRTQAEDGDVVPGSAPSAPSAPRMAKKVLFTTVIAAVLFGIVYYVLTSGYTLDDLPQYGPS